MVQRSRGHRRTQQLLDRLGLPEQFIELNSGTSDIGLVTFAREEIFMALAHELGIQLGRAD